MKKFLIIFILFNSLSLDKSLKGMSHERKPITLAGERAKMEKIKAQRRLEEIRKNAETHREAPEDEDVKLETLAKRAAKFYEDTKYLGLKFKQENPEFFYYLMQPGKNSRLLLKLFVGNLIDSEIVNEQEFRLILEDVMKMLKTNQERSYHSISSDLMDYLDRQFLTNKSKLEDRKITLGREIINKVFLS